MHDFWKLVKKEAKTADEEALLCAVIELSVGAHSSKTFEEIYDHLRHSYRVVFTTKSF